MRTTLLKVLPFLALAGVLAAAQHRNPPDPAQMLQHHVDMLTRRLSLTTQQQQQATSIFTEAENNSKTVRDQMHAAHESLHAAVKKNDTAAIEQISNSIGNLTAQQTMAHAKAMAAFFQTLTPEQQTKLSQMESEHGPGMHRHGGPGGPPPGASFR